MSTACSRPNEETADHGEGEWCEVIRLSTSQRILAWTWKEGGTRLFQLRKWHGIFLSTGWVITEGGTEVGPLLSDLWV